MKKPLQLLDANELSQARGGAGATLPTNPTPPKPAAQGNQVGVILFWFDIFGSGSKRRQIIA